jgi:hypothetical protein
MVIAMRPIEAWRRSRVIIAQVSRLCRLLGIPPPGVVVEPGIETRYNRPDWRRRGVLEFPPEADLETVCQGVAAHLDCGRGIRSDAPESIEDVRAEVVGRSWARWPIIGDALAEVGESWFLP